jgi:hypothetical protein
MPNWPWSRRFSRTPDAVMAQSAVSRHLDQRAGTLLPGPQYLPWARAMTGVVASYPFLVQRLHEWSLFRAVTLRQSWSPDALTGASKLASAQDRRRPGRHHSRTHPRRGGPDQADPQRRQSSRCPKEPELTPATPRQDRGHFSRTDDHNPDANRGQNTRTTKDASRAHAKLRLPGERANAQLKTWHILDKLRCCPRRAGQLAKAIHVLQTREANAG